MGASKLAAIIIVITSIGASGIASADEQKTSGSGPSPYRDCGIGASLFPDTHWAAISSNVIWDLGSTALTSATASPETCNGKGAKVAQFIVDTYANVIDETARGDGEHLTAMLELYGCEAKSHAGIVTAIRPHLAKDVAAPGYQAMTLLEKSERYYLALDEQVRGTFASNCSV